MGDIAVPPHLKRYQRYDYIRGHIDGFQGFGNRNPHTKFVDSDKGGEWWQAYEDGFIAGVKKATGL